MKSDRWDIIDKNYPTPEPVPVMQPRTVNLETDLIPNKPSDIIPKEWYGKSSGWSPDYTRIGYGGAKSDISLGLSFQKPVYPELEGTPLMRDIFPYGAKYATTLRDRLITPREESVPFPHNVMRYKNIEIESRLLTYDPWGRTPASPDFARPGGP